MIPSKHKDIVSLATPISKHFDEIHDVLRVLKGSKQERRPRGGGVLTLGTPSSYYIPIPRKENHMRLCRNRNKSVLCNRNHRRICISRLAQSGNNSRGPLPSSSPRFSLAFPIGRANQGVASGENAFSSNLRPKKMPGQFPDFLRPPNNPKPSRCEWCWRVFLSLPG